MAASSVATGPTFHREIGDRRRLQNENMASKNMRKYGNGKIENIGEGKIILDLKIVENMRSFGEKKLNSETEQFDGQLKMPLVLKRA